MLTGYLETANRVERMTAAEFFAEFGEVARVLRHLPGGADVVAGQVHDLYRRHAREVLGGGDRELAARAAEIRRRELPASCLLRLVTDPGPPAVEGLDDEADSPAEYVFCDRGGMWECRYAGGRTLHLPRSVGAACLHALLSRPDEAVDAAELYRLASAGGAPPAGDAGERTDARGRAEYREEYARLQDWMDRARRDGDAAQVERIQADVAALADEIQASEGLRGRGQRVGSNRERVRRAVLNGLTRVIRLIRRDDRAFADHLQPPRLRCGHAPSTTLLAASSGRPDPVSFILRNPPAPRGSWRPPRRTGRR